MDVLKSAIVAAFFTVVVYALGVSLEIERDVILMYIVIGAVGVFVINLIERKR